MILNNLYSKVIENLSSDNKKHHENLFNWIFQYTAETYSLTYENLEDYLIDLNKEFKKISVVPNNFLLVDNNIKLEYSLESVNPVIKFSYPIYDCHMDFIYYQDKAMPDYTSLEFSVNTYKKGQNLSYYVGKYDVTQNDFWMNQTAASEHDKTFVITDEIFKYIISNIELEKENLIDNMGIIFDIDMKNNPFLSIILQHFKEAESILNSNKKVLKNTQKL